MQQKLLWKLCQMLGKHLFSQIRDQSHGDFRYYQNDIKLTLCHGHNATSVQYTYLIGRYWICICNASVQPQNVVDTYLSCRSSQFGGCKPVPNCDNHPNRLVLIRTWNSNAPKESCIWFALCCVLLITFTFRSSSLLTTWVQTNKHIMVQSHDKNDNTKC